MTNKRIKNDQWYVKDLVSKIKHKVISKPKFQRKKKWDILPKNDNIPNEKAYIQFLFDTENSVHAITFGQEINQETQKICYSNIDGNNRINAIKHFMDRPFEIFSDYLDDLNVFIDGLDLKNKKQEQEQEDTEQKDKESLKKIFSELTYHEIINFKYNKYFTEKGHTYLYAKIKIYRDDFEPIIDKIQTQLKINGSGNFDTTVQINVNLFEGYNTDELCKTFEAINKYNSKLTETELLACLLFNECNFEITDSVFKAELEECIKEYYTNKADGEVLNCYFYDPTKDRINAHDFIVGFQNLCNKKYKFIGKTDVDGLSLYFKLYKALYLSYTNTFTSEHVNDFIEKIKYSCDILNQTICSIFTDKINDKLFNTTCQSKIETLKKNNLFMIISCIIGYKNKNTDKSIIKNNLEKCLLYHFMVSDVKNKDRREDFKNNDSITYRAGGAFIENATKNLLSTPENISNKLTEDVFNDLLCHLYSEVNNPYERKLENGNNKNDKRRPLKFFEKTIMFYYYKKKIPSEELENNDFSIEHICPNSSEWGGELDKDRTGNLIPLISNINVSRGNRHISEYYKNDNGKTFCQFIKDIIPSNDEYNTIIHHDTKPTIINNEFYNNMCNKNEETYKVNFTKCLFGQK